MNYQGKISVRKSKEIFDVNQMGEPIKKLHESVTIKFNDKVKVIRNKDSILNMSVVSQQ